MNLLRDRFPVLDGIFHELGDARSFLDVAYLALEDEECGDGLVVMRHGMDLLEKAHDALDTAAAPEGGSHV